MTRKGRLEITALVLAVFAAVAATPSAAIDLKPFAKGAMTAFVAAKEPKTLPELSFKNAEGETLNPGEWRGRVMLINLWATWCAPCRKEMPSLARLQEELGGDDFEVVAISVDRKGVEASQKFLEDTEASNLALYIDESFKVARDLKAPGLPVTILVDREGREVGRVTGPAEWDSDEAIALIRAVIEGGAGG